MNIDPYDAWALARLVAALPVEGGELAAVSPALRLLAERLASSAPADRLAILDGFRLARPDPDELVKAMADIRPDEPPPTAEAATRRFATCADLVGVQGADAWIWPGWLPAARVSGVAAAEGIGKTRFALDLARRVWHGLPWPDGAPMTLPPRSPTLWVAADGQHDELASTLRDLEMPPEAVVFPAPPSDPYEGTSLDDPETLESLDAACALIRPAFVVVDSLTYATRSDIGEQRSIATLKGPLVNLAQTHQVLIMLLLHVSKEGQALGRRIRGVTRTLLHLDAPDPAKPERLRVWMEKTYALRPAPLGATITRAGNIYDTSPPAPRDPSKGGRPPEKTEAAAAFLEERLAEGDRRAVDLVREWESRGESKSALFRAKEKLELAGRLVSDTSTKPQVWHLATGASDDPLEFRN